ncbi:MAG TPA: GFA family protein [Sphingomicrobium sp.]|nr:GFA family protein [Sphingomicrobium sp.]
MRRISQKASGRCRQPPFVSASKFTGNPLPARSARLAFSGALPSTARWPAEQIVIEGQSKSWSRTADSGLSATYHFCPECGATVHYMTEHMPDLIAIPVGAFADPNFPAPSFSVWEDRKHRWVSIAGEDVDHSA